MLLPLVIDERDLAGRPPTFLVSVLLFEIVVLFGVVLEVGIVLLEVVVVSLDCSCVNIKSPGLSFTPSPVSDAVELDAALETAAAGAEKPAEETDKSEGDKSKKVEDKASSEKK